jgi:hypothetical protein
LPPETFARYLFNIAVDMQDVESDISFYDVFEKEEMFQQWQSSNYSWYLSSGPSPQNKKEALKYTVPLLQNILNSAENMILKGGHGADLRFGHDDNVCPLTAMLHLQNCYAEVANPDSVYLHWANFKIFPMATNVQIIFYRNPQNQVIIKFMLNERETLVPPIKSDILPYYHWNDVVKYYKSLIKNPDLW